MNPFKTFNMRIPALLLAILFSGITNGQSSYNLVISNPAIIDLKTGSVTFQKDILIKGDKIVAIVPHKKKLRRYNYRSRCHQQIRDTWFVGYAHAFWWW